MKISKNFHKPGLIMGFLIVLLMILLSTQCQAAPKPHKDKNIGQAKVNRDETNVL
jgi:hypothetical protein